MIFILSLFLGLILISLPFLVVGYWRKHPRAALIIASLLAFIILTLPTLIQTFRAMLIYGAGDSQLMAGAISEAIVKALICMIIAVPLLFAFQKIMRPRRRSKSEKLEHAKHFD